MEIAIPQPATTNIDKIITLGEDGAEELFFAKAIDSEMPEPGFLSCRGRYYTFMTMPKFSQKLSEYFETTQSTKEQKFDFKGDVHRLSYKDKQILKKEFQQVQKSEKLLAKEMKNDKSRPTTNAKTHQLARESLAPKQHPPFTRSIPSFREGKSETPKTPAQKQIPQNEKEQKKDREKGELRQEQKTQSRQQVDTHMLRKQEKDNNEEQKKRRDDPEEGFAEGERQQKHDDPNDNKNLKVGAIENKGIDLDGFITYAAEESTLLSELFNMRVSHFDILLLFIEVMKLSLKGREQERISRMQERKLQLEHMQSVVDNFKQLGNMMKWTSLTSGCLAIFSGLCPILGHLKGKWILDKLGSIGGMFSKFGDMKDTAKAFKSGAKIAFAMSEMTKSTGEIQRTMAESSRTYFQEMKQIHATDGEENTRTMEAIKEDWKNIERFLLEALQMYHNAVRQLYN